MGLPRKVKIVEVGPRDGLQNEKQPISLQDKIEFVNRLSQTGLQAIEVGSFVSAKWVPQLADSAEVFKSIKQNKAVQYSALVPNLKGLEQAIDAGVTEVAVFTTVSEAFAQKNTNCSVAESIKRIESLMQLAHDHKIKVRGYVSCVLGCPYEGEMDICKVRDVSDQLLQMGCYEVSLGDTIGVGTPEKTRELIHTVAQRANLNQLAVHFHDTYGMAIANIYAALLEGIAVVDASVAGLGGCPYAKGASGNVATEDVVYLMQGLKIETGIQLESLIEVGNWISKVLQRQSKSKVATALK